MFRAGLGTNNLELANPFYDAVLGALGHTRCDAAGGSDWGFWIGWGRPAVAGNGTMVAIRAGTWKEVDAFHAAALASGGTSEGEPGLRPQYNPDVYAAYVRDPEGNRLAAVFCGFTHGTRAPIRKPIH